MYDWLGGARRVAATVAGTPDRVPIYGPLPDHAMYLTGIPSRTFYTDAEPFVTAQLLLAEYYGFDLPYIEGDVHNIEAEALGRTLVFRDWAAPLLDPTEVLIRGPEDLDRIQTPDFDSDGRFPFMLKTYRLAGEVTGLPGLRWFCAPFSLACELMGYPRLVRAAKEDPAFVAELFERITTRILVPWVRRSLAEHPAPRSATGIDEWASFPVITWSMFREYVIPYALHLRDLFSEEGANVVVRGGWGDSQVSNATHLMEQRIRIQGVLRGLDPDVQILGPTTYARVARQHNVALGLGIDSRLIHDGPVEAIVARIKSYVQSANLGGRLTIIINNVPGDTPPEHIHAAVAATRFYGTYPIAGGEKPALADLPEHEPFADFARRRGWPLATRE